MPISKADVESVFQTWRGYRPNPDYCRLTITRRKLIRKTLGLYRAAELVVLIRYANEADSAEARFWRGENQQRQEYLDLTNIFRVTKLDARMERALLWRDDEEQANAEEAAGIDLGPMGHFFSPPGES